MARLFTGRDMMTNKSLWNKIIAVWAVFALVFIVGIFARRLFLLEVFLPAIAFVGFVMLGVYIYRFYKEKKMLSVKSVMTPNDSNK